MLLPPLDLVDPPGLGLKVWKAEIASSLVIRLLALPLGHG